FWGDYPDFALPGMLPVEKQAKNVLEVFLYGGLCPWETFYVVPDFGKPDDPSFSNEQWWTFQSGNDSVQNVYERCYGDAPPPMLKEFVTDENGKQVYLGPFTEPLRARQDIFERLRVHVMSHTLEPHEAAIPYAASGYRLGDPKLAGIGTAIQHYYQAHSGINTGEPYSYVLFSPADFPTDNLRSASAVGQHPGSSRPLGIRVQNNTAFINALKRNTVGELRPQFDALTNHYLADYRRRMQRAPADFAVRSQTLADYQFSVDTLQQTDALVDILEPQFFQGQAGNFCGDNAGTNHPQMGLKLAAHLLTRPNTLARYVCVFDGGLIPASGGGGYDTHNSHIADSGRNLTNLFTNLAGIINEPGEADPSKLNLDETLVVINTEFGRSPTPQNGDGRNHHPYAYTTVMFGGPVGPEQQGIVGSIGPSGYATSALQPADTRGAILSALGIYPFAPESYAVSDVTGASSELDGALILNESILGVKS
ncbi:MAG: hypothetical protein ACI9OJ_005065, partial [Myxococcota bacterium]